MTVSNTDAALDFLQRALGVTVNRIGPLIIVRGG
jgi:ferric-dicitrate binding protein FerR (iron transport regulator)